MTDEAAIFLSYAHSTNLDHARTLEVALRTAGIATFRDETEIADGECFPQAIIDALLGSRVVVVFADSAYFGREYCRWELEATLAPIRRLTQGDWSTSLDHLVIALPEDRSVSAELDRLPPAVRTRSWSRASDTTRLFGLVHDRVISPSPTLASRLGATAAAELRAWHSLVSVRTAVPGNPITRLRIGRQASFCSCLSQAFARSESAGSSSQPSGGTSNTTFEHAASASTSGD
jgi:hypothetical protein